MGGSPHEVVEDAVSVQDTIARLQEENAKLRREADKVHFMRENFKALQCDIKALQRNLSVMQEFVSGILKAVPNEFDTKPKSAKKVAMESPEDWAREMNDEELLDRNLGGLPTLPEAVAKEVKRRYLELREQLRFYESIIDHMPPHQVDDHQCRIAFAAGVGCCNPACNGQWGTGCWCCHYLSFAEQASAEEIKAHLALKARADESKADKSSAK